MIDFVLIGAIVLWVACGIGAMFWFIRYFKVTGVPKAAMLPFGLSGLISLIVVADLIALDKREHS